MNDSGEPFIELRGITWAHERGLGPFRATAEAFRSRRPDVAVLWTVRSLRASADEPVDALAERFDLIVLDHPAIGYAARAGCLLPLDEHLEALFLEDQRLNSVGRSHASYRWGGRQWALATDAAAQVSSYRPDLMERAGAPIPATWEEVLALPSRLRQIGAQVGIPLVSVDAILSLFAVCVALGEEPMADEETVVSRAVGREALDLLAGVRRAGHPGSIEWDPPMMLERMSRTDEIAYCPLGFGYSNYARSGFRPKLVRYAGPPAAAGAAPGGTLGGAGLAVSRRTGHPEAAFEYAAFVAREETQRGVYFDGGGQPGHRTAWTDLRINSASTAFFADTLASLDAAYLRPRYDGYLAFQEAAGEALTSFLGEGGNQDGLLDTLDALYRESAPSRDPEEV
jgi:multiple sugar transport system substrate-binding protein